jgi:hypothetical protein
MGTPERAIYLASSRRATHPLQQMHRIVYGRLYTIIQCLHNIEKVLKIHSTGFLALTVLRKRSAQTDVEARPRTKEEEMERHWRSVKGFVKITSKQRPVFGWYTTLFRQNFGCHTLPIGTTAMIRGGDG